MSAYFAESYDIGSPLSLISTDLVPNEEPVIESGNSFPLRCLPPIVKAMIEEIADIVQVDLAMSASIALAVISGVTSRGKIKLLSQDSEAPLTLSVLVIAAPSEGKSPVINRLLKPLYEIESEQIREHKLKRSQELAEKRLLEGRVQLAEKSAAKSAANATADFFEAHRALASFEETASPRICYDDVTPEGLVQKMAGNGRAFIASAEGGIFQTIAGRYSNGVPNLDAILKAYDGEPLSVDRKGADPLVIMRPLLTMALMVQQHTWEQVKTNADFMGRGFLHRFLIIEPSSKVGFRSFAGKQSNLKVVENYSSLIRDLVDTFNEGEATLLMSPKADAVLADYSRDTEHGLRPEGRFGGSSIHTEWGGKLFGKALRLCGILHCAQYGKDSLQQAIGQETAENAVCLAEWFAGEWLRLMPVIPVRETLAEAIVKWMTDGQIDQFIQSEVTLQFRNRVKAKDIHEATALLVGRGFLTEKMLSSGSGRPAQVFYRDF